MIFLFFLKRSRFKTCNEAKEKNNKKYQRKTETINEMEYGGQLEETTGTRG